MKIGYIRRGLISGCEWRKGHIMETDMDSGNVMWIKIKKSVIDTTKNNLDIIDK